MRTTSVMVIVEIDRAYLTFEFAALPLRQISHVFTAHYNTIKLFARAFIWNHSDSVCRDCFEIFPTCLTYCLRIVPVNLFFENAGGDGVLHFLQD